MNVGLSKNRGYLIFELCRGTLFEKDNSVLYLCVSVYSNLFICTHLFIHWFIHWFFKRTWIFL